MARDKGIEWSHGVSSEYLIHGVKVSIECDHAETGEGIREYLSPYCSPSAGEASRGRVRGEIRFGSVIYPVPLRAPRVLRYGPLRSYFLEGRTYFTDYFSTLIVEPDGSFFHGNLSPDSLKDFGSDYFYALHFTLTLFEALRFRGLYFLHAAALQGPDGTGYLIIGSAGSGKTSLTLSLIDQGFKFLSDDTIFLSSHNEKDLEVMGFAREFHVARDLIDDQEKMSKFSSLPDFCVDRARKLLKPDDWFPEQKLASLKNPRVILFPRLGEDTRLEPLSASEAFTELLPQSLFVMLHPAIAPRHLETLKRVLHHGRAFRLYSGPELKGDSRRTREVIEQARDLARSKEKGP